MPKRTREQEEENGNEDNPLPVHAQEWAGVSPHQRPPQTLETDYDREGNENQALTPQTHPSQTQTQSNENQTQPALNESPEPETIQEYVSKLLNECDGVVIISKILRKLLDITDKYKTRSAFRMERIHTYKKKIRVLRKGDKLLHQIYQIIMQESGTLNETREKFQLWQDSVKSFREETRLLNETTATINSEE